MTLSIIHLLIHKMLVEKFYMRGGMVSRDEVWELIDHRLRFKEKIKPTILRNKIINEMISYNLLERVNHRTCINHKELKIINHQKSGGLERII